MTLACHSREQYCSPHMRRHIQKATEIYIRYYGNATQVASGVIPDNVYSGCATMYMHVKATAHMTTANTTCKRTKQCMEVTHKRL